MFLYELALELDVRSAELVERAAEFGLTGITAASTLTSEQVHRLRAELTGPPSGGPVPAATFNPAATFGPAAAAVPSSPDTAGAGSPPPAPAPPWGGQPAPPWGPAGATASPGGPGAGTAGDTSRRGQWIAVGVLAPFLVALFAFMFTNSGPDRSRRQELSAPATSVAPARPEIVGGLDGSGERTDPKPSEAATIPAPTTTTCEGRPARVQRAQPASTAADCGEPAGPEAPITPEGGGGATPGLPPDRVVDSIAFCRGAIGLTAFELQLSAAVARGEEGGLRKAVLDGRDQWHRDVQEMTNSGPAELRPDLLSYEAAYSAFVDAVGPETSDAEIRQGITEAAASGVLTSGQAINRQVQSTCT